MNTPKISAIVAVDEKRGIGRDNDLVVHISEDLKRFKKLTWSHAVIMGRKTYDSIPDKFRPLVNRLSIVITRDIESFKSSHPELNDDNGFVTDSVGKALDFAKHYEQSRPDGEVFILGGAQIFELTLPHIQRLYVTEVEGDYNADTFFPDYSDFKKVISEEKREAEGYKYKYRVLEK